MLGPYFRSDRQTIGRARSQQCGGRMSYILSSLSDFDFLCGQFAAALQHAEWPIYATLALILVLSALLFPPRNDPDQI